MNQFGQSFLNSYILPVLVFVTGSIWTFIDAGPPNNLVECKVNIVDHNDSLKVYSYDLEIINKASSELKNITLGIEVKNLSKKTKIDLDDTFLSNDHIDWKIEGEDLEVSISRITKSKKLSIRSSFWLEFDDFYDYSGCTPRLINSKFDSFKFFLSDYKAIIVSILLLVVFIFYVKYNRNSSVKPKDSSITDSLAKELIDKAISNSENQEQDIYDEVEFLAKKNSKNKPKK